LTDKLFEVLVWSDDDVHEETYETLPEAQAKYQKIVLGTGDNGKQIMKYESMDDDASGEVIEEFWV